jgi:uncharacterized membrane protein YdjX (TVP38/TMEM64 family)
VLALYLLRPLLLVPITVVNLASGFVLGALPGLALAMAGTLASASIGYGSVACSAPSGWQAT